MTLTLHHHPLSSFCHKVLVALYENGTPFTHHVVNLGDPDARAAFLAMWPVGKIPVLRDEGRGQTVPETSVIIEYLDLHHPGPHPLLPADKAQQLEVRLWDRFFDQYVQGPMQKIVGDRLRPDGQRDPRGVEEAVAGLRKAYDMLEDRMTTRTWAAGDAFSLADCAAAPALFYAGIVSPFPAGHVHLAAYFERLMDRPSVRRVIDEARPYFAMFPFKDDIPARFL